MQIQGTHFIAAPRARVWALLNDPDALAQCAPGVSSLQRDGDDRYTATFTVALGPMKSSFKAVITLSDKTPLEAMTLDLSAQSPMGALGAGGRITLADEGEGTRITWSGEPRLMGTLAAVGGRFAQSAAKTNAETFFTKLEQLARSN